MQQTIKIMLLITLVVGCGASKRQLGQSRAQARNSVAAEEATLDTRRAFFQEVITRTKAPRSEPYPQLKRLLETMRRELADAQNSTVQLERIDRESQGYDSGMLSPENALSGNALKQDLKDREAGAQNTLGMHLREIQLSVNEFDRLVSAYGIGSSPSAPARRRVSDMAQEINRGLSVVRSKLILARGFVSAENDPLWRRQADKLLRDLEIAADRMETLSAEFDRTQIDFDRETSSSDQIWKGPGLSSRDQMGAMEAAHRESAERYEEFVQLERELKALRQ